MEMVLIYILIWTTMILFYICVDMKCSKWWYALSVIGLFTPFNFLEMVVLIGLAISWIPEKWSLRNNRVTRFLFNQHQ